jgi:hypothetical protein
VIGGFLINSNLSDMDFVDLLSKGANTSDIKKLPSFPDTDALCPKGRDFASKLKYYE